VERVVLCCAVLCLASTLSSQVRIEKMKHRMARHGHQLLGELIKVFCTCFNSKRGGGGGALVVWSP